MSRSLPEWSSDNNDTVIPVRVRLRLFDNSNGRCAVCTRKVGPAHEPLEFDHIIPLIAGGKHAEGNIQVLCRQCHSEKTRADTAEKAVVYKKRVKAVGIKKTKRPMMGSKLSPFKRKLTGEVVRREK